MQRGRVSSGRVYTLGLTLVELLIAVLLGLLLSAGMVSSYLGAKRNHYYDEQVARMQENGRYGMRLLSRELVMAGFYAGIPASANVRAVTVGVDCGDGGWALDGGNPLDLVNDYTGQSPPVSIHFTAFTCIDSTAIALSTDLLAVKRTAAEASLLRGVPAANLTSSITEGWYIRLTSGVKPEWEKLRPIDLRDVSRALPSLSYWGAISRIIFVRNYSQEDDDEIPSLCMETLAGNEMTARCLVEGVENMQLEFGIDSDDDGVPNQYTSTPTAAEMRRAVTAKIHLLLRSINKLPGHTDARTYRLGRKVLPATHDAYLRHVLSSTIVLRNHIAPIG